MFCFFTHFLQFSEIRLLLRDSSSAVIVRSEQPLPKCKTEVVGSSLDRGNYGLEHLVLGRQRGASAGSRGRAQAVKRVSPRSCRNYLSCGRTRDWIGGDTHRRPLRGSQFAQGAEHERYEQN